MSKIQENIDQYGWHIISVLADDIGPSFSYSIGLYESFGHPEVIFVGLKIELAQILINNIGHSIKEGVTYDQDKFYTDILDNYECRMLKVHGSNYDEYVGQAQNHYNGPFPLLQCVYPTINGVFPWDKEWPSDLLSVQPLLSEDK
jgi:hypothetical protein